jgi:hypothetical protein
MRDGSADSITTKRWEMLRYAFVSAALCAAFVVGPQYSAAQASKKLEGKSATSAQQKSWEQVDQINRETDATRGRYHQAQQSGGDKKKYTGGNITKSSIFPKAPKTKDTPKKHQPPPKKK